MEGVTRKRNRDTPHVCLRIGDSEEHIHFARKHLGSDVLNEISKTIISHNFMYSSDLLMGHMGSAENGAIMSHNAMDTRVVKNRSHGLLIDNTVSLE